MVLSYCGPHGQAHLMVTRAAMIDANSCVASLRKPLDACDFHVLSAPARSALGAARALTNAQMPTLNHHRLENEFGPLPAMHKPGL